MDWLVEYDSPAKLLLHVANIKMQCLTLNKSNIYTECHDPVLMHNNQQIYIGESFE